MNRKIQIIQTLRTQEQSVIWVNAATYKGSAPFSGAFIVPSYDNLVQTDELDQMYVDVICKFGDETSKESLTLKLELPDRPMNVLILDGPEEVIAHMDWADKTETAT
jgi:hypothetical protein